jgi:hypothetical protein
MSTQPRPTTVRYGKIDNVVVLIFPDARQADFYVTQLGTQSILKKMGGIQPAKPLQPNLGLKPRIVA